MKILDIPQSGKRGTIVAFQSRFGQCHRQLVVPANTQTPARDHMRGSFGHYARAWSTVLTQTQRDAWDVAGPKVQSATRLNQSGPLTGQQHFQGINSARACIGLGPLWNPPAPVAFAPSPVGQLVISQVGTRSTASVNGDAAERVPAGGGVRLVLTVSGTPAEDIMVFGQAPCSSGRRKRRNVSYLGLLPAPQAGLTDITDLYIARFGEPRPGERVFIVTRQQKDGWEGFEQETTEIVPPKPADHQAAATQASLLPSAMHKGGTRDAQGIASPAVLNPQRNDAGAASAGEQEAGRHEKSGFSGTLVLPGGPQAADGGEDADHQLPFSLHLSQRRLPLVLVLLLALAPGCHGSTARPKAQPLAAPDFPPPPQQSATWNPETNRVSAAFISATRTLFDQGLSDPRGCEYRSIELYAGGRWPGTGGNLKTCGWVLPPVSDSNQSFAVCWNGLVYPVASVGRRQDLLADIASLLTASGTNSSRLRMVLYARAIPEEVSLARDSLLPLKACLLLRLGEDGLAAQMWDACRASMEMFNQLPQSDDPYLLLAGDWAWGLFDRTITAHMRGDVPLALVSARKLAEMQPRIEAEAAKRGFPRPYRSGYGSPQPTEQPYLPFLAQLPQLLADLERRAREPKQSVREIGRTNLPSQSSRIAALVEDLDLVSIRQFGQPGRVPLQMDPMVEALIREGTAAVGPLLDCWQYDKRLTRSVGFGRNFFRDRHVLPVASAAKVALEEILQTQFQNVADARAFWSRYKGLSPEDRWYQILRDEKIGQEQSFLVTPAGGPKRTEKRLVLGQGQWMEAARMIVQPENIVGVPGTGLYSSNALPSGAVVKLRGEPLRGRQNPSVTQLLVKQADFVAQQADHLDQFEGVEALRAGFELTQIIFKWEKPAALAPARSLMRRAIELWPDWKTFTMSSGHDLARYIPGLTEMRVECGDTNALDEYAAWIKAADEEKVDEYAVEAFEPLWRNPRNPAVVTVSQRLFNDPASPWSKLPWKRSTFHDPLESGLVNLPAFRKLLARELDDQSVRGSMQWRAPGTVSYNLTNDASGSRGALSWPKTETPADGTKVEVRRCDWIAWSLSQSGQIPFFNPFAPVEKRDQAIQNAKAELLRSR